MGLLVVYYKTCNSFSFSCGEKRRPEIRRCPQATDTVAFIQESMVFFQQIDRSPSSLRRINLKDCGRKKFNSTFPHLPVFKIIRAYSG